MQATGNRLLQVQMDLSRIMSTRQCPLGGTDTSWGKRKETLEWELCRAKEKGQTRLTAAREGVFPLLLHHQLYHFSDIDFSIGDFGRQGTALASHYLLIPQAESQQRSL